MKQKLEKMKKVLRDIDQCVELRNFMNHMQIMDRSANQHNIQLLK